MFKLRSTILKDIRILTRDKVGLTLMFVMPVLLAIVITAIQNNTFELVNDNKVPLLVCNRDTGQAGVQLVQALQKIGMFNLKQVTRTEPESAIKTRMHAKDALAAIVIPSHFSTSLSARAAGLSARALNSFGLSAADTAGAGITVEPVILYYHPVLQQSFRSSLQGALHSALQIVQNKQVLQSLYFSLNQKELPASFEQEMMSSPAGITEIAVSRNGSRNIPNATQHNIPAWTIFAMFFIVISLGGSVVREKLSGSFLRLKTLPTSYLLALVSKQITYLAVTLFQTALIFGMGAWLFPRIGLPALNIPADKWGLLVVSVISGWCAVSYAICIGVWAQTQEQANGFGAVSVVLLAAIGGILVPGFAMPASFQGIMRLSPLHWCLEAFYGLFLEGGKLKDVILNLLNLLGITLLIQALTWIALKRKNLI